jgi:hypothetical protein
MLSVRAETGAVEVGVRRRAWTLVIAGLALIGAACDNTPETFPPPERGRPIRDASFEFVVIGDFGAGGSDMAAVSEDVRSWVERLHADALVTTGDNIYQDGSPSEFDEAWHEPYGWVRDSGVDVLASLGNHDVRTSAGTLVMDLFDMPDRWYVTSIGDADIFVLDANRPRDDEQLAWMKDALARSDAVWKIAVFHQPAYSCSKHDGEDDVIAGWVPIFEQEDVDLVLNGHDHNYQRFEEREGVTYVVTGGGGNPDLYALDRCPPGYPERVAGNDELHHFLVVQGSAARLRVRAIGVDGTLIDDFSLAARRSER